MYKPMGASPVTKGGGIRFISSPFPTEFASIPLHIHSFMFSHMNRLSKILKHFVRTKRSSNKQENKLQMFSKCKKILPTVRQSSKYTTFIFIFLWIGITKQSIQIVDKNHVLTLPWQKKKNFFFPWTSKTWISPNNDMKAVYDTTLGMKQKFFFQQVSTETFSNQLKSQNTNPWLQFTISHNSPNIQTVHYEMTSRILKNWNKFCSFLKNFLLSYDSILECLSYVFTPTFKKNLFRWRL